MQNNFSDVSLLITHFNRSKSLEGLLKTLDKQKITFNTVVVSDDGSNEEHLSYINNLQKQFNFQLITTPVNKGLGNNINKGQDKITTPYTLYIQEDFEPSEKFVGAFKDALEFMNTDQEIDIARFYAYFSYPYMKPYGKGFSKMIFKYAPWYGNHIKFYVYSDHPHLRRSNFFEKFGRFKENEGVVRTEFLMAASFIKHNGCGIFYDGYSSLFSPKNTVEEPSTVDRAEWRQKQSLPILAARYVYLRLKLIKWTLEVLFTK